ncbi:VPLPA-CTERM sorting domain-containing protein, partial [Lichenihabitans sp. Uapishka_5]|uniref:VPLPA-CTERM sorting domain-containing protein n=1 Tax=Lichenihabitans sp. Uapishka_5 TaxID=3037302 RepID=UPI0029E7CF28
MNIDLSHAPSVSSLSEAGVHPQGSTSGQSVAFLAYYFKILGPTTMDIPVLVQANGQTKVSGPQAKASAFFKLLGPGTTIINQSIGVDQGSSTGPVYPPHISTFNVDNYYNLFSNTEYLVLLDAETFAGNGYQLPGPSLASGFIDPYFAIDPSYSDYSLVFSNGIHNTLVSSVPLPASAPMFGAALLALGAMGFS